MRVTLYNNATGNRILQMQVLRISIQNGRVWADFRDENGHIQQMLITMLDKDEYTEISQ